MPGTLKRGDTPSVNLLEAFPKSAVLIVVVRNVVSATPRMLMTTPLMT